MALSALAVAEEHDLPITIAWCLETLTELYGEWGKLNKAEEFGYRALAAYNILGQRDQDKADVNIKLGKAELRADNVSSALIFLNAGLQIYRDYNQHIDIAKTKRTIAQAYGEKDEVLEAKRLLEESFDAFQKFDIEHEIKKTQEIIDLVESRSPEL